MGITRSTRTHRLPHANLLAAGLALVLSACTTASTGNGLDRAPLAEQIVAMQAGASFTQQLYSSPDEATPLVSFNVEGEHVGPVSDMVVVGRISGVLEGHTYSWPTGPQVAGEPATRVGHTFNSADGWISTVYLVLEIEETIPADSTSSRIEVGVSLLNPVNVSALEAELLNQRVAVILVTNEKTAFDERPGALGVAGRGELLGFVDDQERVTFPAFDHGATLDLAPNDRPSVSLGDLMGGARTIVLHTEDGVLYPGAG